MKKFICIILLAVCGFTGSQAQDRKVQNRPYTDLRRLHFGVLVGTHLQDLEFLNVGPQVITGDDGTTTDALVTCDQDRWDPGFHVGVLGELRLNTYFQLRVAPAMYFGSRHITFHNFLDVDAEGRATEEHQQLKTAYFSTAIEMIAASPRFNNHRPYVLVGLNPMINLSGNDDDYLRLKRYDCYAEVGVGCDFYLPFFKLRPELKFLFGLTNCLDKNHINRLQDKNMVKYAGSVSEAKSRMIVLTFNFD